MDLSDASEKFPSETIWDRSGIRVVICIKFIWTLSLNGNLYNHKIWYLSNRDFFSLCVCGNFCGNLTIKIFLIITYNTFKWKPQFCRPKRWGNIRGKYGSIRGKNTSYCSCNVEWTWCGKFLIFFFTKTIVKTQWSQRTNRSVNVFYIGSSLNYTNYKKGRVL
jgi:hypothetical protein